MSEDPDTLVDLTTTGSEFESSVIVESLKARDIPAFTFSNAGMTLQWEVAASLPFRVSVRRKDVELAREVLRAVQADSIDIDWSQVDVGSGPEAAEAKDEISAVRSSRFGRWLSDWGALIVMAGIILVIWYFVPHAPR